MKKGDYLKSGNQEVYVLSGLQYIRMVNIHQKYNNRVEVALGLLPESSEHLPLAPTPASPASGVGNAEATAVPD